MNTHLTPDEPPYGIAYALEKPLRRTCLPAFSLLLRDTYLHLIEPSRSLSLSYHERDGNHRKSFFGITSYHAEIAPSIFKKTDLAFKHDGNRFSIEVYLDQDVYARTRALIEQNDVMSQNGVAAHQSRQAENQCVFIDLLLDGHPVLTNGFPLRTTRPGAILWTSLHPGRTPEIYASTHDLALTGALETALRHFTDLSTQLFPRTVIPFQFKEPQFMGPSRFAGPSKPRSEESVLGGANESSAASRESS